MASDNEAYTTAPIPNSKPANVACQLTVVTDMLSHQQWLQKSI